MILTGTAIHFLGQKPEYCNMLLFKNHSNSTVTIAFEVSSLYCYKLLIYLGLIVQDMGSYTECIFAINLKVGVRLITQYIGLYKLVLPQLPRLN